MASSLPSVDHVVWTSAWGALPLYLAFLAALPFAFHETRNSAIDRWIGELSYPVYLTHLMVLALCGQQAVPAIVYTLCLSAAIGVLMHYGVERRFKRKVWVKYASERTRPAD